MKYLDVKVCIRVFLAVTLLGLTGCKENNTCECDPTVVSPIAIASVSPKTVSEGGSVFFDASGSSDSDGSIVSYQWVEGSATLDAAVRRKKVETGSVLSTEVSFSKSDFSVGVHTITLIVTDDDGATGMDEVNVTVNPIPNQAPTAEAGENKTITVESSVTLDGSDSSDPDGSIVSYQWREGSTELGTTVSFTTSEFSVGLHTITLTVTDDDGAVDSDDVNVTVNPIPNQLPVAKAGADKITTEGDSVTFDGSKSFDPDGSIVSYQWREGSAALSSTVSFSKSDFSVGLHTITLTVTDDDGAIGTDEVNVTVNAQENTKPVAYGQTYTVQECNIYPNEITLGAYDADEDSLTYHLVNTDNMTNGTVTIPDENQNKAIFTMTGEQAEMCSENLPNSFTFKVNDGIEDSDEGGVTIDPPGVSCEVNSDCSVGQYCNESNMCRYET